MKNFPFYIASRYLFSRKSHNAINFITMISACGVCFATAALVCVLSVFNGLEVLMQDMFGEFDPMLKITVVEGKVFEIDTPEFDKIRQLDGVLNVAQILEENALLKFDDQQVPATIKGVSDNFTQAVNIENVMFDGKFTLQDGAFSYAVAGIGIAARLGIGAHFLRPLHIYAPKRMAKVNLARPETAFNQRAIHLSGIFDVGQANYNDTYLIVPIAVAQELFDYEENQATALELKVSEKNTDAVQKQIRQILGSDFHVKNRYEQQEAFFRIMKIEKWIGYLILCFILLIAVFNIIGSLSMLILEKKDDIKTLFSLGVNEKRMRRIFFYEGWLVSLLGGVIGIVIGIALCLVQQHFGIIRLGGGGGEDYVITAYPVQLQLLDTLLIFVTVMAVSFLAVQYPCRQMKNND
ncbi:MAG: FtsX-like permease family protein [Prevotellaceae bacterium]|jgi:ABC-type lipoprotein release transport system permease subunit|nr:FtsX-like permease family protein [Prevotellaceae bacterium]